MSKTRFGIHVVMAAVVLAVSISSPVLANLVTNGSFEIDAFAGAGAITGWTGTGNTGLGVDPAVFGYPTEADNGLVPDGGKVAYLLDTGATLSQTIYGMTAGTNYHLYYRDNARSYYTAYNQVTVKIGDQTIDWHYFNSVEGAWSFTQPYYSRDIDFTVAADGNYVLSFIQTGVVDPGLGSNYHACSLVDNIVLTGAAVPEPTSMLALFAGIASLAGVARKRKA